ncbi:MAG: AbrB/MazE/SpoVT family DNA-binding domain-containing protein [Candidatus Woesearchaeota archaeon]
MKRKVIQIADSTQLVSLPRKWCLQHGIKKGDELEVEEDGNRLIVSTERDTELGSIEVDVTPLDRSSLIFLIRGLYKKGYDEIKLIFNKPLVKHYRLDQHVKAISAIHTEVNRLTGMEIVQEKENLCILRAISKPTDKELDSIIRRVFILLLDAAKDVVNGAKSNDQLLLETIEEKHDTITKFISYSLRIMNKIRNENTNTHFIYHIIATLDKITDLLKNCGRDLKGYDKKLTKESVVILDMMYHSFELYKDVFYKFDLENVRQIAENKEQISARINALLSKLPPHEIMLLSDMHQSLELFRDLVESRMAMEF